MQAWVHAGSTGATNSCQKEPGRVPERGRMGEEIEREGQHTHTPQVLLCGNLLARSKMHLALHMHTRRERGMSYIKSYLANDAEHVSFAEHTLVQLPV